MSNFEIVQAIDRLTTEIKALRDAIEAPEKERLAKQMKRKERSSRYSSAVDAGYLDTLLVEMMVSTFLREKEIDVFLSKPFYVRWFDDSISDYRHLSSYEILSRMTADERKKYLFDSKKRLVDDIKRSNDIAAAYGIPTFTDADMVLS